MLDTSFSPLFSGLLAKKKPIAVPRVLVTMSIMPDERLGRKAWTTSMVKLIVNPKTVHRIRVLLKFNPFLVR
jgi:hypothetical protein